MVVKSFFEKATRQAAVVASLIGLVACIACPADSLAQENEGLVTGRPIKRKVEHGYFYQYAPTSVTPQSKVLVICHGMFSEETAAEACLITIERWKKFADQEKLIVLAPAFDNKNFAATKDGAFGGYRTLTGREVRADVFLHEIIEVYEKMNPEFDGKFLLFGHSAGAQFANRYLVKHPQRVLAALISSPAWYAFPRDDKRWPHGMLPRKGIRKWGDTDDEVDIGYTPDPSTWVTASQLPILAIVGEEDNEELKDSGENHVTQAQKWVAEMNALAAENDKTGTVQVMVVQGVGHNYGKLVRAGLPFLKTFLHQKK